MLDTLTIREPAIFYSYLDEENFFRWLESIPAVTSVSRVGLDLEVSLRQILDEPNLRDLIAIFRRYGIDMKCLRHLATSSNESWFKNPIAYWYKDVFQE